MIALKLTGIKSCMSHLLLSDTFDNFYFIEGEITTFNTFQIDGFLQKDFFDSEDETAELPEYSLWKQVREFCFTLIRGKKTPLRFKFVFSLSPQNIARLIAQNDLAVDPGNVQGLYLNLKYDGTTLQCITGTSMKIFSMDRSLEQSWDSMVQKFLDQKGIPFERMD